MNTITRAFGHHPGIEVTMSGDPPSSPGATLGDRLRWTIERHLGITHAEFAQRLGVKASQLSRWVNRREMAPSEGYVRRMAELGGVSPAWLRYGVGSALAGTGSDPVDDHPERPRGSEDEIAAEDLFRHFEGVVRRLGGTDVDPDELQLRKLDVVEGLTRLYAAQGTVPGWVYTLKRRILDEDL